MREREASRVPSRSRRVGSAVGNVASLVSSFPASGRVPDDDRRLSDDARRSIHDSVHDPRVIPRAPGVFDLGAFYAQPAFPRGRCRREAVRQDAGTIIFSRTHVRRDARVEGRRLRLRLGMSRRMV